MGYRLREIREQKKMTQEALAEKSGISRQTISAIELNKCEQVKSGTLVALATALETTIDNIFFPNAV